MRAETYLNLSRAHASLGGLERSLSYARHSLYNECGTKCRSGLVHLTVARVYLEMGGFSRALEGLQGAFKVATAIGDPSLELQVYVALSELFGRLQDNEKSAIYASKAYDLSRSLQLGDLNSCYHRAALLRMAVSLRKQGELGDAQDYCKVKLPIMMCIDFNKNGFTCVYFRRQPNFPLCLEIRPHIHEVFVSWETFTEKKWKLM